MRRLSIDNCFLRDGTSAARPGTVRGERHDGIAGRRRPRGALPAQRLLCGKLTASTLSIAGRFGAAGAEPMKIENAADTREAMLFDNESRIVRDHDRGPRLVMEDVLGLA